MRRAATCHVCREEPPPSYEELFPAEAESTGKANESINENKGCEGVSPLLELKKGRGRTYFKVEKVWPDGEGVYEGELDWKRRRTGHGKMVWADGSRIYTGYWHKNKMCGEGVIWWAGTGTYYTGGWRRGLVHGYGRLVYGAWSGSAGDVYEGQFRYKIGLQCQNIVSFQINTVFLFYKRRNDNIIQKKHRNFA